MTTCQRIVFHVGDPKCGSTAIQYAINAGRIRVGSETLRLLGPQAINHNYVIIEVRERPKNGKGIRRLKKDLRTHPPSLGVFSAELAATISADDFDQRIAQPLTKFSDDFRVLFYVRDHGSRLVSQFVESIKIGDADAANGTDLEGYVRSKSKLRVKYVPYFDRYKKWASRFQDKLIVRPFRNSAFWNQNILEDFVHAGLGVDGDYEVDNRSVNNNASPSVKDLMVLRVVQDQLVEFLPEQRHTIGQEILELMPHNSGGGSDGSEKLEVHRSLAEFIFERYIEDARRMDTTFFAQTPFMVESLEQLLAAARAEAISLNPRDHLSEDEIRYVRALTAVIMEMSDASKTWEHSLREDRLLRVIEDRPATPGLKMSSA